MARYFPSSASSGYETHVFFPKILSFDSNGNVSFRGKINESPLPLAEALSWSKYGERTKGKGFHHVYAWSLGELSKITSQTDGKGFVSLPDAPVLLFFDEVEAFKKGTNRLIIDDSSGLFGASYEALFTRNGQLYRVYAYMVD